MAQHFDFDEDFQNSVTDWLHFQAAEFFAEAICKLVKRYDKCLNLNDDYVEK